MCLTKVFEDQEAVRLCYSSLHSGHLRDLGWGRAHLAKVFRFFLSGVTWVEAPLPNRALPYGVTCSSVTVVLLRTRLV